MNDSVLARARKWLVALAPFEPSLYAIWAGVLTLLCASRFYGSIRLQTTYADLFRDPEGLGAATQGALGPWSAPLDDVFIHFDFARQTALGHPFEWAPGTGYSSGGTSLLYPFVLVPGLWLKQGGLNLMHWAAVVACVSVFGFLLALRRLWRPLPRATSYLIPPALLCVGALDWSFWSGMEVALFCALWGLALIAWDDLRTSSQSAQLTHAAFLGGAGLLVCATRPEGIAALAVLVGSVLWQERRQKPVRLALLAGLGLAPGLSVLVIHGIVNRMLTGDSTAAGALVKLEMHHPYMTRSEVFDAWWFHFKYQIMRVTQYHFSDVAWTGWCAWLLAVYALVARPTRTVAIVLWLSMLGWIGIVALNGQVRWQNERYTMPAVAWLLTASGLGISAAISQLEWRRRISYVPAVAALGLASLFVWREAPRFREQLWFFGRASRNIYDQHVQAARLLRDKLRPRPHRVLVGDAGAIPYVSGLSALDIIGLGGFHGLPFARATRQNVAAGIELIERLSPAERPDVMAIYPGWWGDFPLWFGKRLDEVPVRGNVICGGASKVLYLPRWESLDRSELPFSLLPNDKLIDSIDQADLVSEKQHAYALSNRAIPQVGMKLLANPEQPREDLWDAGRIVPAGVAERFKLEGFDPARPISLIVRAAPAEPFELEASLGSSAARRVTLAARDGWVEQRIDLPAPDSYWVDVSLTSPKSEHLLFHVWAVQTE